MMLPVLGGFQNLSLVDYPGQACAVLFLQGCNLRCTFCHNPQLIPLRGCTAVPSWDIIWRQLLQRQAVVKAVCITGGEPCVHATLPNLLQSLKNAGFKVKLDTNGTNPALLEQILADNLVDYVAMDVKGPLDDDLSAILGKNGTENAMKKSLKLLATSRIPHEFRTTWYGELSASNLLRIQAQIPTTSPWYVQRCNAVGDFPANLQPRPDYLGHPQLHWRGF
ncbi:MAG: anaerobic ribonucleoside-triphosphate reductase activating protein [Fibrobacter sp.]|nr:anaerobic ribonucleoside-triphosphate reductase activating protein [Fibrobacter sp.]